MVGLPITFGSTAPSSSSKDGFAQTQRSKSDRDVLQPPRMPSAWPTPASTNSGFAPRGSSLMPSGVPGSFAATMRSLNTSRSGTPRPDASAPSLDYDEDAAQSKRRVAELKEMLNKEIKIKEGSENLLDALNMKKAKQTKDQLSRVEDELNASNQRIFDLKSQIEELQRPPDLKQSRLASLFQGQPIQSPSEFSMVRAYSGEPEPELESPTFSLDEILQSLEADGMPPDYYIEKANTLVELFKRHPTLKYDLAWSVFGLRVQTMLLSDSKEVIAAGYRMTRYAITDRKSLQIIRALNTDYLVILSLVKESKASVEREQALKFVRAFLDVTDGVREVSAAVVRTIVAVAEHPDDRLRGICIETLAEILIRDTPLLVASGGVGPLMKVLGEGQYEASESLMAAFLYLLDTPDRRRFMRPGYDLEIVFSSFTDSLAVYGGDDRLKANARTISSMLKTWPGILTLSMYNFRAIKSLVMSLHLPSPSSRDIILELLFDVLRIKPPSWSSSFLAGRRLTTYGRVAHLKSTGQTSHIAHDDEMSQRNLVDHYTALMLAVLFESDILKALLGVIEDNSELALTRKATLLLGEILQMAGRLLPTTYSANLQLLPELFTSAASFGDPGRFIATTAVYQIDSVNRTLYRSFSTNGVPTVPYTAEDALRGTTRAPEQSKPKMSINMDESQFRNQLLETQVLNTTNYQKWKWDVLLQVIEGPLLNPKRLDEAIKATKFIHRLMGFYRPFKFKFSNIKNTKPNQRYVRVGCALVNTLMQNPEGVKLLAEDKVLRQMAECLAQLDRMSGLTSVSPLFSKSRLQDTVSGGYFQFLGTMSKDPRGITMMERWRMINMFYHIIELQDRDDLITTLLSALDYSVDGHLRILLSRALTGCSKTVRICATNVLQKYATAPIKLDSEGRFDFEWAIRLLITQLYDPEVEVCETAVKILEEACNRKQCLEYVVKCRPALDHLGEIGAPLLLRFLSTSVGYYYLDELDYISQEMDDWFLGRNDTYVTIVEASLSRALDNEFVKHNTDTEERNNYALVPPHFYRELARTQEGCRLLEDKGHFTDFCATIQEHGMEYQDAELIVKVKGCLWAVGNVGSMELGAPFLEESDVVPLIVKIAEQSQVMTMRGTAFFVLGLISRSVHGLEILDEFGWDGTTTTMGVSLGFCVPLDLNKLFSIPTWEYDPILRAEDEATVAVLPVDDDPTNAKVLKLVQDLGNTVLAKKAGGELMHLKSKRGATFQNPALFRKVLMQLERHHYRLQVRRFVIDLFDKRVLRQLVVADEDSDEANDSAGDSAGGGSSPPAPAPASASDALGIAS